MAAGRSDYTRLLRWWLDQGYTLGDLTGVGRDSDIGGGVRSRDFVEWDRTTPTGKNMKISTGAMDAISEQARQIQAEVRRQAETGARLRIPLPRGDSGAFEAWGLKRDPDEYLRVMRGETAAGQYGLRQQLSELYRDVRIEVAPPSLRVYAIDRQGTPLIGIEGVGRGNVRSPQKTQWGNVLKERQTRLTQQIRAADRAASTRRTAPARERAADRASALRAEREAVKHDRRRLGRA